ncbi:gliding motility-associated C-terminal domain-containing protein [Mucilaginibacter flavus]|uniref:T9SS type B sorting domain-containing protein n=1 Tax=Mucilaginibacter flavus TaxID=931504 RepID=UPI0025B56ACE|nr:gliding motility-associated C-terminal domain-containing protein [Mucilaginibacter flavus]MDN3582614.1 gliding motility-associated C-terminal domain-containing protein [Mucilaginibacter flavus]
MKINRTEWRGRNFLFIFLPALCLLVHKAQAQGPVITPKAKLIFSLDATGNKTIVPADVATVSNVGNSTVTVSPSAFNCSQLGSQTVTLSVAAPSDVEFTDPVGIVTDPAGDIFFSDASNHLIKKITPDGTVSTLAGNGADGNTNGPAATASFGNPAWMAMDHLGNLFVVDYQYNEIRKITPDGMVSSFGSGFQQQIQGVVADQSNNIFATVGVYINKITPDGTVSLFAGIDGNGDKDGTGTDARFSFVRGITIDPSNNLFVLDYGNSKIKKITPGAVVTTIYSFTQYSVDGWLTIDAAGDLFMTQEYSVWELSASGVTSNFVGTEFMGQGFKDGTGGTAEFNQPGEITTDAAGDMYVTDQENNAIRKISPAGLVTTLVGGVSGNKNGNIYHSSVTSQQIPVTIITTPLITTHPDETIAPRANCSTTIPDYSINAGVSDVCSQTKLKVTQVPVAGTAVGLNIVTPVTLTVTDGFGGTASTSFSVTSTDQPVITAKSGPITLLLDASGNYAVKLSDVATVSGCSTPINVALSPISFTCASVGPQTVGITATYPSNGVSETIKVPVNVRSSLIMTSEFNSVTLQGNGLCPLYLPDYRQQATATDNCFNVTFTQTPVPGTVLGGSEPFLVTITASDSYQNTAQKSFTVTPSIVPPPTPVVTIEPTKPVICAGTSLTFTAVPINLGTTFTCQWQVNGVNAGDNAPTFTSDNFKDGDQVTCSVTGGLSCLATLQSQPVRVMVNPLPQINMPDQVSIDLGHSIQLNPIITGTITSYLWSPSTGLSNTSVPNPLASPQIKTNYRLVVTTSTGCQQSSNVTVSVLKPLVIPNTFTPNSDGINDTWNIPYLSDYTRCTVDVFTRYGQKIFHSNGYMVDWDGTYDGKELPNGTYYYVIDLKNTATKLSGFIAIIR